MESIKEQLCESEILVIINQKSDDILECIDYSELKNIEYTGFGELYKAFFAYRNVEVVLQYINEEIVIKFLIQILKIADESNISKLFGMSLNPEINKYVLLIDYKKIKLLEQHLEENTLDWSEKYRIMINIVNVLKTFHEKNISPNNFDPNNILISKFDCSKFFIFAGFGRENIIAYTAPEILRDEKREPDQSSDMYALGMIFYRIIFDQVPFADIKNDESRLKNEIINGARPQFLQDISYFLKELIRKCWDANPSNRPKVYDLEKIFLQNPIYEFRHFPLNDKQEPQNISTPTSFNLYSKRLLESINVNKNYKSNYNYINFYPLKGDKHIFKASKTDNPIINQYKVIRSKSKSCDGNVKTFIKKLENDELLLLKKQLNDWNSLKYHENIVSFLGIAKDDENNIHLILPFAHEGNLRDYLKKNKKCSLKEKINIATNIADGLLYIHKDLDIIHGNIYPKNILMFDGVVKISDLPLPCAYTKEKSLYYYEKYLFENIGYIDSNLLLNEDEFKKDKSMDIYNFGFLLWEIVSGKIPYSKDKDDDIVQLVIKINDGYREDDISNIKLPSEYTYLFKKCWNGNKLARPKIDDVYEELLNICTLMNSANSKRKRGNAKSTQRKKRKKNPAKKEMSGKKKGKPKAINEDEKYRWDKSDGIVKWNTFEHNGPYFPRYVPHNVKMKCDGKEVNLEPEAENVATLYAKAMDTKRAKKNPAFNENFFRDFKKVLAKSNKNPPIEEFNKCDFMPIVEYLKREKRKSMSKKEKQRLKEENLQLEEKYGFCYLNGQKQKIANFKIEPLSLFLSNSVHPKAGSLRRLQPEQITINIGKGAKIPKAPAGHNWKRVIHDNTVTWLATWKEIDTNKDVKYVSLATNIALKSQNDYKKFEKARKLNKGIITKIRDDYERDMRRDDIAIRQRATAMYFIDRLALRVGTKKRKHESDTTVGCCLLRFEHIKFEHPNTVHLDFLGKNSIRYQNTIRNVQVYENLKTFKNNKTEKDKVFNEIDSDIINEYLSSYMKGLTAKDFRTYHASYEFQKLLKNTPVGGSVDEKIETYKQAICEVSKLLNHRNIENSKKSYIDPRIPAAWRNKHDVPIDKVFSKSLREKFKLAMEVDKHWEF